MLSSVDVDIHNTKKEAIENVNSENKVYDLLIIDDCICPNCCISLLKEKNKKK